MDITSTLLMRPDQDGLLDLIISPTRAGRGTLAVDKTLATSALIAFQSDRRAQEDDELPNSLDGLLSQVDALRARRGWVGDVLLDGTRLGSRLWLLSRGKYDELDRRLGAAYAEEALDPICDWHGVDKSVSASLENGNRLSVKAVIGRVTLSYRVGGGV
ncbi:Oxidoreductase [Acetobacteraceae bacterium EV16G]|uniref:Oxidoreductase n=1 Tax=Sorlinia euscelidii TaxID=3081148 RepID=A0ABU7U041_9PROT